MTTEISDVVSDVVDLAEDVKDITVQQSERVVTVVKNNPRLVIVVGVVGLAVGAIAGFKYAEKTLTEKFEERLAEELAGEREMIERMARVKAQKNVASPTRAFREKAEGLADARRLLHEQGYAPADAVLEETIVESSVTIEGVPLEDDEFDYAHEVSQRTAETPYVITHDEFLENEREFAQVTIVYYSGDQTLADEREEPITDLNYTVGAENLMRFGHGSRDSNIVYVRNERLELDFEIQRSYGTYAQEVMGYTQEERTAQALQNRVKHGGN